MYTPEERIAQLEQQLKEVTAERDFLQKVVDRANVVIAVNTANDPNEVVHWHNARYEESMGFNKEMINANPPVFFDRIHPNDQKYINDSFQAFIEENNEKKLMNADTKMNMVYRHKNMADEYRWIYINATGFEEDDNGLLKRMLVVAIDLTDRIEREHQLEELLAENARQKYKAQADKLTEREKEILVLVSQGKSDKEISELLAIGYSTARTHRNRLMKKLKLGSVAEISVFAKQAGFI